MEFKHNRELAQQHSTQDPALVHEAAYSAAIRLALQRRDMYLEDAKEALKVAGKPKMIKRKKDCARLHATDGHAWRQ